MKTRITTFGFLALVMLIAVLNRANAQTIRCSSDDGRRHYCAADTRGGVQLSRQVSGSPCTQGYSWGYDRSGIWVDRGCRADFVVSGYGGGGYPGGGYPGGGGTIRCSSENGGRQFCPANTQGGVQLSRQVSDSACIQGSTWGWDRGGIWVDRGCRADFVVGGYGGGGYPGGGHPGGYPGGGSVQTITCSSDDGGRRYCPTNVSGGVQLTRQISGSPCVQGSSWGWDPRGVWVDRGCRAEFRVTSGGGGYPGYPGGSPGGGYGNEITCSSNDGGRQYCPTGPNRNVSLKQQISGSPCTAGRTWGADRNGVWVDRGCRAVFSVRR
ncbi:MAG TPA: DUF3011 domain-containing protein [Terriglobales bacterium]|nr:DUF3011 domain-containing protein [Terriglobales bacterium]